MFAEISWSLDHAHPQAEKSATLGKYQASTEGAADIFSTFRQAVNRLSLIRLRVLPVQRNWTDTVILRSGAECIINYKRSGKKR